MEMMTLERFYQNYKDLGANELILDVRTSDEFAAGHVEGSRNINHTDVAQFSEELKKHSQIYIYCRRGARAQFAAATLMEKGLNNLVCIFDAGMEAWSDNNWPLVK